MRVRTAVSAAALAAAAALTLTACGGGSGDGNDKISAAPSTTTTTPPSTPSATGEAPLKIDPALAMPSDVKVVFDWATPKNASQAAALSGAANYIQAIDHAVVKQNKNDVGLRGYAADDALSYAQHFVQENLDAKLTLTGTDRYYEPTFVAGGSTETAEVKLCDDQSKLYSKDVATGKVHVTGASDRNYVLYDIVMVKLPAAHELWQAHAITVKEKALQCKQ
jgi:hypothetical protein